MNGYIHGYDSRYAIVTPTVTPTVTSTVAYRYTRVTLTRRARPATESRALRYRPLAGDAT